MKLAFHASFSVPHGYHEEGPYVQVLSAGAFRKLYRKLHAT
jgi:hypothetical protein